MHVFKYGPDRNGTNIRLSRVSNTLGRESCIDTARKARIARRETKAKQEALLKIMKFWRTQKILREFFEEVNSGSTGQLQSVHNLVNDLHGVNVDELPNDCLSGSIRYFCTVVTLLRCRTLSEFCQLLDILLSNIETNVNTHTNLLQLMIFKGGEDCIGIVYHALKKMFVLTEPPYTEVNNILMALAFQEEQLNSKTELKSCIKSLAELIHEGKKFPVMSPNNEDTIVSNMLLSALLSNFLIGDPLKEYYIVFARYIDGFPLRIYNKHQDFISKISKVFKFAEFLNTLNEYYKQERSFSRICSSGCNDYGFKDTNLIFNVLFMQSFIDTSGLEAHNARFILNMIDNVEVIQDMNSNDTSTLASSSITSIDDSDCDIITKYINADYIKRISLGLINSDIKLCAEFLTVTTFCFYHDRLFLCNKLFKLENNFLVKNIWSFFRKNCRNFLESAELVAFVSHILLNISLNTTDNEFREGLCGIEFAEIKEFISDVRLLAARLYINLNKNFAPQNKFRLIDVFVYYSTTNLLRSINSRDARSKFYPGEFWAVDESYWEENRNVIEKLLITPQKHDNSCNTVKNIEMLSIKQNLRVLIDKKEMCFMLMSILYGQIHLEEEVQRNLPFLISLDRRILMYKSIPENSCRYYALEDIHILGLGSRPTTVKIRRDFIFEDAITELDQLGDKLRNLVKIILIDKYETEEEGVDGGGIFKEFILFFLKSATDLNRGLFECTDNQLLYPSPKTNDINAESNKMNCYRFIGRVIGKAIYDGVLLESLFAPFFLSKIIGRGYCLEDLALLDNDLYNGLLFLIDYKGDVEKDIGLTFSLTCSSAGVEKVIPLINGGEKIPVSNENKYEYIARVVDYKLNAQIDEKSYAIIEGMNSIINTDLMKIFNPEELQTLIGGEDKPIDIYEFKANVNYSDGFSETHPTIVMLWRVVEEMPESMLRDFIKFVTSCSRPPIFGFSQLNPSFCVKNMGDDQSRLPQSATCVNLLKMPAYNNIDLLREKLIFAISCQSGFYIP